MIIDVHVHLGWDYTFDEEFKKEELIEKLEKTEVEIQIVQPGSCHTIEQAREEHDDIASLCKEYPGHFFGMANPSPHLPKNVYDDEIARCVEDLWFVAIKLHPLAFGVNPDSVSGRKAFEAARKHHLPIMVHTGSGIPFAGPVNLLSLAEEYPEVPIIMAHCGQIILANEAAVMFKLCKNVYGDTSWSPGFILRDWIRSFPNRIMLGSDHADNTQTEIAKIKTAHLTQKEQRAVFQATAMDVFKLKENL
ncbi:MAG: amidohydrolase family protein [Spirochaetota bacterium]